MRIAFIHPDLGIGGAERLVIDAAVGLQQRGHELVIYTSYRDVNHCFDEARDGTLEVRVCGDSIVPANFMGRFSILCAMLRQIHLVCTLLFNSQTYDAVFIDQLSIGIPLLKLLRPQMRILFYCHFPDKLLSHRKSLVKQLYRIPFDFLEGWTTGQADTIVVNSKFTASVFKEAFPRIRQIPTVVYPCVDVHQSFDAAAVSTDRKIVLSINRFERKKNLGLALRAFAALRAETRFTESVLVIAGGHDTRVQENVSYHKELVSQCEELGLAHKTISAPFDLPFRVDSATNVYFLLSIPTELKSSLLASSSILAYTPEREHFGIVPIEASLAGLPVIAQDNGGPLETVVDAETGYLRPAEVASWASIFREVLFETSDADRRGMGRRGRQRVLETFSQEAMSRRLEDEYEAMAGKTSARAPVNTYAMVLLAVLLVSMWRIALRPLLGQVLS